MRIAILTSGIRPVPAVQGGAVENLIDFYLAYNDQHHLHDINVYSIWHPDAGQHPAQMSESNHYKYIKTDSLIARIKKHFYHRNHKNEYYHYTIEYFFEQAYKHIKRNGYDAIIIENRPYFALKLKERTSTPCILHLHNDFLNPDTKRAADRAFQRIICVSDFITERVRMITPDGASCITVHNAIDSHQFSNATPMQRNEAGLSDKDFVMVYCGRLTKEKGALQLIQAIRQLNDQRFKLLVIGASAYKKDLHPTPFIRQLNEESEPIKDQVIFTGFIDYRLMPSYLKMADIAVVPSMWEEPFGLTIVEAMAAGLPLITTRSGGIPEICEGVATIVDRENIVDNLATAILGLYEHPEKRDAMAKASLERSKLFDKETYAKNFFKALEGV